MTLERCLSFLPELFLRTVVFPSSLSLVLLKIEGGWCACFFCGEGERTGAAAATAIWSISLAPDET